MLAAIFEEAFDRCVDDAEIVDDGAGSRFERHAEQAHATFGVHVELGDRRGEVEYPEVGPLGRKFGRDIVLLATRPAHRDVAAAGLREIVQLDVSHHGRRRSQANRSGAAALGTATESEQAIARQRTRDAVDEPRAAAAAFDGAMLAKRMGRHREYVTRTAVAELRL